MATRITIRVSSRRRRQLEVRLTEEELGACRRSYWENHSKDDPVDDVASFFALADFAAEFMSMTDQEVTIAMKAVTLLSLWVGGIYWYKERTPPAAPSTRMRAFHTSEGDIFCPRCAYQLVENNQNMEEPYAHSKTLRNPRFKCPHCNSDVLVSSRKSAYREAAKNKTD